MMATILRLGLLIAMPDPGAAQGLRFRPEEPPPATAPAQPTPAPAPAPARPRVAPPATQQYEIEAPLLVPGETGVLVDPRTRCAVWVPDPQPDEIIRWSGRCRSGVAWGEGELIRRREGRVTGLVNGRFEAGRLTGPAVVTHANGWRVEAEFTNGVAPYGIVRRGADIYQGELRDNLPDGRGIWVWANGARYEGGWRHGLRSGRGRLLDARGEYDGMWREDRRNGVGMQREGETSIYRGTWQDDRRHGPGIETFSNGVSIQGNFVDNQPQGRVIYTFGDRRYEGELREGCLTTRWRSYRVMGEGPCP